MKRLRSRPWFIVLSIIVLALVAIPAVAALAPAPATNDGPTETCAQCPVSFNVPSIFAPNSLEAGKIVGLFNFILIVAAVIFTLVEVLLIFAVIRFRNRRPEQALQIHGNTKLEIAWTATPGIILAVLMGFTLRTMTDVRGTPTGENVLPIKVIGHQWWWEFRYPDQSIITANELVVPLGSVVDISIESVDVEHGFWAPELFGKVDAVPGYTTRLKFTPTRRGTYGGQCTQFCGTQHAQMRFSVVVVGPDEFNTWVANQQAPAVAAVDGAAKAGEDYVLNSTASACKGCHTINGTAAAGTIGPNLTHVGSRAFIAGGVLATTPENLKLWVHDAPAYKDGILMPSFALTMDEQTAANVAAYLASLK